MFPLWCMMNQLTLQEKAENLNGHFFLSLFIISVVIMHHEFFSNFFSNKTSMVDEGRTWTIEMIQFTECNYCTN